MKWVLRIVGALAVILLVAFLFLRTPDTDRAKMRAKYAGETSQFVELDNGMTVHLVDEGAKDAPAIVMLHGSFASLHTWEEWAKALSPDFRVIRYDQRAHGLTGPAPDPAYAREDFSDDLNLVADRLGLDSFVLVGSSMGGNIAVTYALENPERLDGLVLVGASGAPIEQESGGMLAYTISQTPVLNKAMRYITPRSMVETSLRQSVTNEAVVTDEAVDRYWELARYPGTREATRVRLATSRPPYTAEQMAKVETPTLLIWGEQDALVPFAGARWYEEAVPNATLIAYPGIGHLPMEEHAEQSAADLRAWLESLAEPEGDQ